MYLGLINTSALISAEAQNLLHQLDSITEAHLRTVYIARLYSLLLSLLVPKASPIPRVGKHEIS